MTVRDLRSGRGTPGRRRNGSPGAPNQYRRYSPLPILWKPVQPHEGLSGAREGEKSEGLLRP